MLNYRGKTETKTQTKNQKTKKEKKYSKITNYY